MAVARFNSGHSPSRIVAGGSAHGTATVTGRVMQEGGPPFTRGWESAPLLIVGRTAAGSRIVLNLRAGHDGRFSLHLHPGHYILRALVYPWAAQKYQPTQRFTVHPGKPVNIRLVGNVV